MLDETAVEAFNTRATYSVTDLKNLTVAQQDRVKAQGVSAEALLKNKDLALFFHTTKFEITDQLGSITGHSQDDNNRRIALSNQLSGLNSFIETLKHSVYLKNTVVKQSSAPADLI
jgi:hypothetical protein